MMGSWTDRLPAGKGVGSGKATQDYEQFWELASRLRYEDMPKRYRHADGQYLFWPWLSETPGYHLATDNKREHIAFC